MTTTRAARALPALAATASALALTACGSAQAPEAPGGPIVLSTTSSTGSPTTASPSTSPTPQPQPTGGAAPVAADVRDDGAELEADDQTGTGATVRVTEVRLTSGSGHVVVIDTRTRAVLGSAVVEAGRTRTLDVALATRVPRSGELLVVLHADDGDGRFDAATDGQVVDDEREPVDEDLDYTLR